jgi:hypothetical protein
MATLARLTLTDGEIAAARTCAKTRLDDAIKSGAKDRLGSNSEDSHFWGALGEIVIARYIDRAWHCASRTWAARDVGRYEVRAIPPGTRPYIKAKPNDPAGRAIALVLFRSQTVAEIAGWMTAGDIRRLGTEEDPGGRSAPAHFLRDLSLLNQVFPEIEAPWGNEPAERNFPLLRDEEGNVIVNWSTCADCGEQYAIEKEHLRSFVHIGWVERSQTISGQTAIPVPPQPETYKFTSKPPKIQFGAHLNCPRCHGILRKNKGVKDEECMDPSNRKIACIRCNGFGVIPNVGPVATAVSE